MPELPFAPKILFLLIALPLSALALWFSFTRHGAQQQGFNRFLSAAVFTVLFFVFLALHFHYFPQDVDDSFISFRFAENLAHGQGLCFNAGEPIEGFSNLLWVGLLALAVKSGFGLSAGDWVLPLVAKLLSITCHLTIYFLIYCWAARKRDGFCNHLAALPGLAFFVAAGANAFWATSGMETSLHSLLLLLLAISWSDLEGNESLPAHPVGLIAAMLLLVVSRPEGILFGSVMLALWWHTDHHKSAMASRNWKTAALLFAGWIVTISVFRFAYFGNLLPNTFYAKATGDLLFQLRHGLQYLGGGLLAAGGWIWAIALWPSHHKPRTWTAPHLLIAAQFVFILLVGGDWMSGYRFIAPIIPLAALAIIRFMREHADAIERFFSVVAGKWKPVAAMLGLLLLVGVQALAFDRIVFFQNDFFVSGFRKLDLFPSAAHYEAALEIRRVVEPSAIVAVNEAGLIPYISQVRTLDCVGLLDRQIGLLPGLLHEKAGADDILKRKPEYILLGLVSGSLNSAEMRGPVRYINELLTSSDFTQQYSEIYRNEKFLLYKRSAA